MSSRRSLEEIYTARDDTDTDEFREAYEETRRSYEFGVLTRALRKAAGRTQKELATGTTVSAIARLETGGTTPIFATLERLADALGVQLRLEVAKATDLPAVTFGASCTTPVRPIALPIERSGPHLSRPGTSRFALLSRGRHAGPDDQVLSDGRCGSVCN